MIHALADKVTRCACVCARTGLVRGIGGVMPGPIALTLAPPVSVESVALAVVAGALGPASGKIDGTDAINAAAKLV
jgi:hypothetical protein